MASELHGLVDVDEGCTARDASPKMKGSTADPSFSAA